MIRIITRHSWKGWVRATVRSKKGVILSIRVKGNRLGKEFEHWLYNHTWTRWDKDIQLERAKSYIRWLNRKEA